MSQPSVDEQEAAAKIADKTIVRIEAPFASETKPPSLRDQAAGQLDQAAGQLDQEDVGAILAGVEGNVTEAAKLLDVEPMRLRAFVAGSTRLKAIIDEAMEQGADTAVGVLFEGLRSDSFQNRYYAAKEFLRSDKGRKRGFGKETSATITIEGKGDPNKGGIIELRWIEPTADIQTDEPKLIEHEP